MRAVTYAETDTCEELEDFCAVMSQFFLAGLLLFRVCVPCVPGLWLEIKQHQKRMTRFRLTATV